MFRFKGNDFTSNIVDLSLEKLPSKGFSPRIKLNGVRGLKGLNSFWSEQKKKETSITIPVESAFSHTILKASIIGSTLFLCND